MMHRYTAVGISVLLVLACTTGWAQTFDTEEDVGTFRVKVGMFDLGEADTEFGLGADYEASNWMASADYVEVGDAGVDLWSLSGSYLLRQRKTPGTYYGGGVGYYKADGSAPGASVDDGSIGFHILGGMSFGEAEMDQLPPWFAEFRWVFGTDFTGDVEGIGGIGGDYDGWKLMVGRRF